MSNQDELKRIWKEEAAQQKEDNKKKQKIIQKREVKLTFGGVKKKKHTVQKNSLPSDRGEADDFFRRQLGL